MILRLGFWELVIVRDYIFKTTLSTLHIAHLCSQTEIRKQIWGCSGWGGLNLTARHYALWTKGLSNPTCSAFRAHRWPILVPLSREGPLRTTLNYHSNTHSRTAAPPKTPISVPTPAGPLPSSSALTLSPDSRTKLDPQRTNGAFHCGLMGLSILHWMMSSLWPHPH